MTSARRRCSNRAGRTGLRARRAAAATAVRFAARAQTPKVWRELDEWLRHRLRAIQLKHWKKPGTIYRELKALGAAPNVATRAVASSRRWWRNSDGLIKPVLTIAHFDRLGVPRLS